MRLSEIFIAHQGEGPTLGIESVFVRLHGCPVQCAWCDTAFTWDGSERGQRVAWADLARQVQELAVERKVGNVVLTGGEPAIEKNLGAFVATLCNAGLSVEVETSGALPPTPLIARAGVRFNVSPKLASARPRLKPDVTVLRLWLEHDGAVLKFVVDNADDFAQARSLVEQVGVDSSRVWLMPQATTREQLATAQARVLELARGTGYRVTTRMHVLAYDGQRGT